MMILTRRGDNNEMFYSWEAYYNYMFNPEEAQKTTTLFFTLRGAKTYQEKKEALRELAKLAQWMDCGGLGWWDEARICEYFTRNARKFGLLREFRENGIPA